MKPIRVNADYESMLFERKAGPRAVNQSIEFLALYLEDQPLLSEKNYSEDFLHHVRKISGRDPVIVHDGGWENWWGELRDISLEQRLNSKEFILPFSPESKLVTSLQELELQPEKMFLAKSPFGMSGQNFLRFSSNDPEKVAPLLAKCQSLIVEPLYQRMDDFSHYVFPDDSTISYQNIVDQSFQYRGTLFLDHSAPELRHLSFFHEVDQTAWTRFEDELKKVKRAVREAGGKGGYSVDSFTYMDDGGLRIRVVSEVNYRKTMGLVAYRLSQNYFKHRPWTLFLLGKSLNRTDSFSYVQKKLSAVSDCLHLSPGNTRFEIFLLGANSLDEGRAKFEELRELLPECQFTVKI